MTGPKFLSAHGILESIMSCGSYSTNGLTSARSSIPSVIASSSSTITPLEVAVHLTSSPSRLVKLFCGFLRLTLRQPKKLKSHSNILKDMEPLEESNGHFRGPKRQFECISTISLSISRVSTGFSADSASLQSHNRLSVRLVQSLCRCFICMRHACYELEKDFMPHGYQLLSSSLFDSPQWLSRPSPPCQLHWQLSQELNHQRPSSAILSTETLMGAPKSPLSTAKLPLG